MRNVWNILEREILIISKPISIRSDFEVDDDTILDLKKGTMPAL